MQPIAAGIDSIAPGSGDAAPAPLALELTAPCLVQHDGKLVALARAEGQPTDRLWFRVLDPQEAAASGGAPRWTQWFELRFPEAAARLPGNAAEASEHPPELRLAGADLLTVGPTAATPDPADAGFAVVSVGRYLQVFRPSAHGTLYLDRFVLREITDDDGQSEETSYELERAWEVRYQRSGLRDVPDGDRDTQSVLDMTGEPFLEPTLELWQAVDAESGAFAVARVPTADPDVAMWYIAVNGGAKGLRLYRCEERSEQVPDFAASWHNYTPILATVDGVEGELAPRKGLAPALAFYAEQDPAQGSGGEEVEIGDAGRLMLAFAVDDAKGPLDGATAVYDFAVGADGCVPELSAKQQGCVLADGKVSDGKFKPDTKAASYPSGKAAAEAVRSIDGLTVQSVVLGQVRPETDPVLRPGDDGLVHLYYGGPKPSASQIPDWGNLRSGEPQALVAHFDPRVSRAVVSVGWSQTVPTEQPDGEVRFVARQSGPTMAGVKVAVSKVSFGSGDGAAGQDDLCEIDVTYPSAAGFADETWTGVPRDVRYLPLVLDGGASDDAGDPSVLDGATPYFDFSGTKPVARVPVSGGAAADDPQPRLTLVSARADLPLATAEVVDGDDTWSLALRFAPADADELAVTYPGLLRTVEGWQEILSGQADGRRYDYDAGSDDTALIALATTARGVPAPLLVYPTSADQDISGLAIRVEPDPEDASLLSAYFEVDGDSARVDGLPRAVADFVEGLRDDGVLDELGLAISDDGAGGDVATTDGEPAQRVDLRGAAVLFDLVLPPGSVEGAEPAEGAHPAGTLERATKGDGISEPDRLSGLVAIADQPETGAAALIADTDGALAADRVNRALGGRQAADEAQSGAWLREEAPYACAFDGTDSLRVPVATDDGVIPASRNLRPQPRWTLETWAKPETSDEQRLVTFHDGQTDVPDHGVELDYHLGLTGATALRFAACDSADDEGSYVRLQGVDGAPDFLDPSGRTWEWWARTDKEAAPSGDWSGMLQFLGDDATSVLVVELRPDRKVYLRAWTPDGVITHDTSITMPYDTDVDEPVWSHLALTAFADSAGNWTVALTQDGARVARFGMKLRTFGRYARFGLQSGVRPSFFGQMAQVRCWDRVMTTREIARTAFQTLSGAEDGLLGYWPLFEEGGSTYLDNYAPVTGEAWDGKLVTRKQKATFPDSDLFMSVLASVGGSPVVEAPAMVQAGRWSHLGLVYEAGGALRLNTAGSAGPGWARVDDSDIEPGRAFAIDAWIGPEAGAQGGIISRWESDDEGAFQLVLDAAGELTFSVRVVGRASPVLSVRSADAGLIDGKVHHVAARYLWIDSPAEGGPAQYVLKLYADGKKVGSSYVFTVSDDEWGMVDSTEVPLAIGASSVRPGDAGDSPVGSGLFRGLIGRVRVWGRAPSASELFPERKPWAPAFAPPRGLLAQWDLTRGEGRMAEDRVGGNDAVLTSPDLWAALDETSTLRVHVNGAVVPGTKLYGGDFPGGTRSQLRIGKLAESDRASDDLPGISGEVAQLALWGVARDPREMRTQVRVPLVGDEPGLLAAWDFRGGGWTDITGGGNDIDPAPAKTRIAESDAPITMEGALVRNVYGGRITDASESVPGRPAVGAFIDVRYTGAEVPTAAVVRAYLLDPAGPPLAGIEVGSVDLVYIGQRQTSPQLIGFIEGAPPLPSENLTRPYYMTPAGGPYMRYLDAAKVGLSVEEATNVSYSASTTQGGGAELSGELAGLASGEIEAGPPVAHTKVAEGEAKVGVSASFKFSLSDSDGEGFAGTWARGQRSTLGLDGDWEPFEPEPDDYLNPQVGRRFEPANTGMAVVESLTADCFAVVFHATGAALGTIVLPNLQIPPDRNVVLFPMADSYTKQGTLDGKVGFVDDSDWPGAAGRGSYFRPSQAYALAAEIDQRHARDQAYAAEIEGKARTSGGTGGVPGLKTAQAAGLPGVDDHLPVGFVEDEDGSGAEPVARAGIVNRYVWSAGGGLYTESEQIASTARTSYQGSFGLEIGGAVESSGKGIGGGLGVGGALSLAGQYAMSIDVGVERQDSGAVSLSVEADGEGFLRRWDPYAPGEYGGDGAYDPGDAPGKVTQYRFMSFYLPPSTRNGRAFAGVVDPVWLALSPDAAARALRELDASAPSWRVLHRVTYVERVPPPVAGHAAFTDAVATPEPVNVEGNARLLAMVAEQLGDANPVTPVRVGAAVAAVLNPPPDDDGKYPKSVLEEHIDWWGDFLDAARPGDDQDQAAADMLHRLVGETVAYCVDGYKTGVLPLEPAAAGVPAE